MKAYTSTWKHQPKWSIRSKRTSKGYETRMTTSDKRFIWVEKGTKRRYRRMSGNWSSKSVPGSLKPRAGSGTALGFYRTPRPGIKARNNLETMARPMRRTFPLKVQAKINAAAPLLFS